MNLRKYVGKHIRIVSIDGRVLQGKCLGFTQALDNEPEIDSLELKTDPDADYSYEIYENRIKKNRSY